MCDTMYVCEFLSLDIMFFFIGKQGADYDVHFKTKKLYEHMF